MKLIIVESPAKCKTIAKILGNNYKIIATMGHVRDLPKNKIGIDVENNFLPIYQISQDKKENVKKISDFVKKADEVYIATDEDREGEAIGWHVTEICKLKDEDFKRIAFHEITPIAIKNAIKNPRKLDKNLIDAQQARRILDRLVGYNLSPLLSKKIYKGLSAGRVQSATLKLIIDKEREIQKFIPEEYWTIDAICKKEKQKFKIEFIQKNGIFQKDLKNEEIVDKILKEVNKDNFFVSEINNKEREKIPTAPFITSTLQQAASRFLGFSSK